MRLIVNVLRKTVEASVTYCDQDAFCPQDGLYCTEAHPKGVRMNQDPTPRARISAWSHAAFVLTLAASLLAATAGATSKPETATASKELASRPSDTRARLQKGAKALRNGDYATALSIFTPLAEHGDAKAQNNLGSMYRFGHGVPQDGAKALHWYRKAAVQGDAKAQNNLGYMYAHGLGVPQDYVQGAKWFILVQAAGTGENENTGEELSTLENKMAPAQIAQAQRLARKWWAAHHK